MAYRSFSSSSNASTLTPCSRHCISNGCSPSQQKLILYSVNKSLACGKIVTICSGESSLLNNIFLPPIYTFHYSITFASQSDYDLYHNDRESWNKFISEIEEVFIVL